MLEAFNAIEASLAEVAYCVHVAGRLGYFDETLVQQLTAEANRVGAPLVGLIRSIRKTQSESIEDK